MILGTVHISEK